MREYTSAENYLLREFAYTEVKRTDDEVFDNEIRTYYEGKLHDQSVEIKVTESRGGHWADVQVEHRKVGFESWDFIDSSEIYIA